MLIAFSNKMIAKNGIDCVSLISPENSVKIALARIQKTRPARIIFITWPKLEQACVKLARIISHECPDQNGEGGTYLLDRAFRTAIEAYEQASIGGESEESMATEFLRALIAIGSEVICYRVHLIESEGATIGWTHYSIPIHDWVRKNKGHTIYFSKREDVTLDEARASRTLMASHLCSVQTLVEIDKSADLETR